MDAMSETEPVVPNPRLPKTLGILNIVFAAPLLLCGACQGFYLVSLPAMAPILDAQQKQVRAQMEAQRNEEIASLREQEKQAQTKAEKHQIRAQRLALEASPLPVPPQLDFKKLGMNDPRVMGYYGSDAVTGLVFNLLMLVAGIGLIGVNEWGRKLALWVAGLKIARLLVLAAVMILVVVPVMSKRMEVVFAEMQVQIQAQQRAAPGQAPPRPLPPGQVARMMGTMMTVYALGMLGLGSIYPAISLWLLTRPSARAACQAPRLEPDETTW